MKPHFIRIFSLFILTVLSFNTSAQKTLEYSNKTYEPFIKTVKLYPNNNLPDREILAPVVSLNGNSGLILEFDALLEDYLFLQAKIIHCNADWTPSRLSDIDILSEFNSFDLNNFEYSINTKTLFVHYIFEVPPTRVSGNYIIMVYQNSDVKDVVLSRRFMVYENALNISTQIGISSGVSMRNFNQQIDFSFNYGRVNVSNPLLNFHVVIRQNQRWDNAIIGLQPTKVRRDQKYIEYHQFTMENNFKGGNEFRYLDLSTYSFRGQNVAFINDKSNPITAIMNIDKNRSNQPYAQYRDLNGQYIIDTQEPLADKLEADYIDVTFQLSSNQKLPDNVFVIGAFNDWQKLPSNKLSYDKSRKLYHKNISLKQGYYGYMYYLGNNPYYFDGSYYQTENEYDILIYYRESGYFTDRLVGYKAFNSH